MEIIKDSTVAALIIEPRGINFSWGKDPRLIETSWLSSSQNADPSGLKFRKAMVGNFDHPTTPHKHRSG
jgi:hypothetical protein